MADRREQTDDPSIAMRAAMHGLQGSMWTALPGIVLEYDAGRQVCRVQPSLMAQVLGPGGVARWVKLPPLLDCPVVFPSGGGYTLTFPVLPGDEVLVVFASRCIDSWWQSGGVQVQAELRMHDLSDGFAIPGPRSQPRRLSPGPATDGVELRSDDGAAAVRIDGGGVITMRSEVKVRIEAPVTEHSGAATFEGPVLMANTLTVAGVITGHDFYTDDQLGFREHGHGNVRAGGDISGPARERP